MPDRNCKPKPGYKDRVIRYSLLWVNGKPKHNNVDNECVADFSCCYPSLFTQDDNERRRLHAKLVKKLRNR